MRCWAWGIGFCPAHNQILEPFNLPLALAAFSPCAEEVATQPRTGWGEMVAWEVPKFGYILLAPSQGSDQVIALIQFILPETHYKIALLEVAGLDQTQRFLRTGAEFGLHSQARGNFAEQGNRAVRFEIVEAQGDETAAAAPTIGSEQVELATEAVAQPCR